MLPGFLFGFQIGLPVAIVGKNLGNFIQIMLARTFLKTWAQENIIKKYENGRIAQHMIHSNPSSIFLVRVVSMPLYVKNFGLGAMNISLYHIMTASIVTGSSNTPA